MGGRLLEREHLLWTLWYVLSKYTAMKMFLELLNDGNIAVEMLVSKLYFIATFLHWSLYLV